MMSHEKNLCYLRFVWAGSNRIRFDIKLLQLKLFLTNRVIIVEQLIIVQV